MNVYMYQAAFLCEECGEARRATLTRAGEAPESPDDESSYDSGDFPKGPYPDGGGESDGPNHCDMCHVFLENPLTAEGIEYVRERAIEATRHRKVSDATDCNCGIALDTWAPYYGIRLDETGNGCGKP